MTENNNQSMDQNTDTEIKSSSRNRNLMIIFGSLLAVVVVVLIIVLASRDDDDNYSIAVNYIKARNYDAALVELEKIKPEDKDYVDAVSTINFVRGVQFYRRNLIDEAYLYLLRVDPSDQFYSEAKNYIAEIERMKDIVQQPDTVYLVDTVTQTTEADTVSTTTAEIDPVLKNMAMSMLDTMKKFEEIYIQSETVSSGFDIYKTRLTRIMDNFNKLSSGSNDPELQKLNGLVNSWMITLIKYIDAKIVELAGKTPAERPIDIKRESIRIRNEIDPLVSSVKNRYRIF
jgi:hypothetical protein